MQSSGSILGVPFTYNTEGSPLIPPVYAAVFFICFLLLVCAVYIYFYRRKRPVLLWHKVRLLAAIAVVLIVSSVGGGSWLVTYWLVPPPHVSITIPEKQRASFSPTNKIEIYFDRPVNRHLLEKSISPETPGRWVFEDSFYATHVYRKLVFYPTYSLHPDTVYTVKLSNIQNFINVFKPYDHTFVFTTQASPTVATVTPAGGVTGVDPKSDIVVQLTAPNFSISDYVFLITPKIEVNQSMDPAHTIYTLRPKTPLASGVTYHLIIQKTDVIFNLEDVTPVEREETTVEYDGTFTIKRDSTVSSFESLNAPGLQVSGISPVDGWTAVNTHSPVKITFDQEVDHESAEKLFSLTPPVAGAFTWNGTIMTFVPEKPLNTDSSYAVTIAAGVRSVAGRASQETFKSVFTTQNATTKLAVPAYLQQYTLSCEIASLRMALNFRGLQLTENDLIPKVGQDPTPHRGNIWGNPTKAFVGNIAGTQMKDGYGVHWAPIAKAARNWRDAQDFTGWSIEQLTQTIEKNNPVVIWVYSHYGTPTSWKTPDNEDIHAVRDEHAVVATGFVGPAANPTQLIINDPLLGQVYLSRTAFDKKWNIFGRSGVVIF